MFDSTEVVAVTQSVWASLLEDELSPSSEQGLDPTVMMTSCVHISGAWEGAICVDCSTALARRVTGAMFDIALDEIGSDELVDALGEIANMIGGNVKSMVEGSCLLSLPAVTKGTGGLSVPGSQLLQSHVFKCAGEPLRIAILCKHTNGQTSEKEPSE